MDVCDGTLIAFSSVVVVVSASVLVFINYSQYCKKKTKDEGTVVQDWSHLKV